MPNLAMRMPGTLFSGDGLDLSWPLNGEREVVAKSEEEMTLRVRQRIAEGNIVIVDDAPTKGPDNQSREYRLLTGEEARKHMAEPAGPVTRVVYHPATPEDEQDYQLEVQSVRTNSPTFIAAQKAAAEEAETAHAELVQRQVDAEKKAQDDAEAAAKEAADAEDDDDPVALTHERTREANDAKASEVDKAFMELEQARQDIEAENLKHFDARAKAHSDSEVDDSSAAADKDFMAQEKARQKVATKAESERQDAAKAAEKAAEEAGSDTAPVAVAGKSDPYVGMSTVGRKAGVGVTSNDVRHNPKPETAKATTKAKPAASKQK